MAEFTEFGATSPFASVGPGGRVDYAEQNRGVTPIFSVEARPFIDEDGMIQNGEQEIVKILVAGDQWNQAVKPVDDEIRARFAAEYARFKAGATKKGTIGIQLGDWPAITKNKVAEFALLNVFTVENLADISDQNLSKIMDGRAWREKAKGWLAGNKDAAAAMKMAEENQRLKDDIAELRKVVADLSARMTKK